MAGSIGVGAALRRAREIRGITVEEAARDTKLRAEQLRALEAEEFDALGGQVYARAQLGTYAKYLGLRAEKVVGIYARHAEEPPPPPVPGKLGRVERAIAATRFRDNQKFLLIAAAVVLVALISVGMVSRGGAPAAVLPSGDAKSAAVAPVSPSANAPTIDVTIVASNRVEVSAVVDGDLQGTVTLRPGEVVSYAGSQEVQVSASDGGLIDVTVNGKDLGAQGPAGQPWSRTWTFKGGEQGSGS